MTVFRLFRGSRTGAAAHGLYGALVAQARQPAFYEDLGVPDTVDGRFDMIALHAFLVFRRLKRDHDKTAGLAQALFDLMFADMDENLREMGVGDLSVGNRVKDMARAFYGRLSAYEAGLAGGDAALAGALRRNLFRDAVLTDAAVAAMVRYTRDQAAALDAVGLDRLVAGDAAFAPVPGVHEKERKP